MKEFLIATKNPGKFKEILEALRGILFKPVFLGDMAVDSSDFVEDGLTFAENARKKAKYFADKTGMMTLAEDSGLLVDALEGELGVRTRRWGAGENATDKEWIDYFMKRMEGIDNRMAKFVCSVCLFEDGKNEIFEAETVGRISESLLAPILPGIPLSSCFIPEGLNTVYAALGIKEKNKVSHRGKAMREVRKFLR